jgi:hypothetical protein
MKTKITKKTIKYPSQKRYYDKNKLLIIAKMHKYNKKNRKKINERQKIYYNLHKNLDDYKEKRKKYKKIRREKKIFNEKTQKFERVFPHDKA